MTDKNIMGESFVESTSAERMEEAVMWAVKAINTEEVELTY